MVVTEGVRDRMRALFEGLLPEDVLAAYDRLLARDGCPKDEADGFVGGHRLVQALTDRGMAHVLPHSPADPAWLQPASPDLALQGVLAGLQANALHDQSGSWTPTGGSPTPKPSRAKARRASFRNIWCRSWPGGLRLAACRRR